MSNYENVEMRAVYTQTLIELAEQNDRIVLLEADLMRATGTQPFMDKFPQRTFNVGVAEANMVGVAAGLSSTGKIPFANTFASFAARRTYDQFFISANYARLNVKLVGSDPGITALYNGGTHMPFEDLGLMRNIPGLTIFEPSDAVSLKKLVKQASEFYGCTYMRLNRRVSPVIYAEDADLQLGKGYVLRDGDDVAIFAIGAVMVNEALAAADVLGMQGISAAVIDMHTLKPLDKELVLSYAQKTKAIVTCENHQVINGLGSAIAEYLSEVQPTLMRRVGVMDEFGEVGDLDYLMKRFGMTAENITQQTLALLKQKEKELV
ncbi:MAG: transketolase [Anaerolineaceae bacterium]|nr:transketolase [Anaerolineaceae bacterium]